jgi:hypothetical protein
MAEWRKDDFASRDDFGLIRHHIRHHKPLGSDPLNPIRGRGNLKNAKLSVFKGFRASAPEFSCIKAGVGPEKRHPKQHPILGPATRAALASRERSNRLMKRVLGLQLAKGAPSS